MIRLVGVELTRLRWRRAVILLLLAAVIVPVVIWAVTAWNTRPASDADLATARAELEQPYNQRQLRRCENHPREYGAGGSDDVRAACEAMIMSWTLYREPLSLSQERRAGSGVAVVVTLTVLMVLAGTTFVGHDWNSGSMSNQLLFEARRGRIWAAKGLAVFVVGLVVAGLVLTAYWTGLWMLSESRGLDPTDSNVSEAYQQALRGTVFVAFAGLGGYALTMFFRSTVATLGVLFGVSLLAPLMLTLIGFNGYERWLPQSNVAAVINDGATYWVDEPCSDGPAGIEGTCSEPRRLSLAGGSAYLGGLLLLAAVPSVVSFRRRDVP